MSNTIGAHGESSDALSQSAIAMYLGSEQGRRIEATALANKTARASRPLAALACLHVIIAVVLTGAIRSSKLGASLEASTAIVSIWILAAGFVGVFLWSRVAPLPAAIVGLLLYTSLGWVQAVNANGHGGDSSPLMRLAVMATLIRAVMSGSKQRQLERALEPTNDSLEPPGAGKGLASAAWLYVALLWICMIPLTLAKTSTYDAKDQFDVEKLMGIVVITWGIISWRETLPAVRKIPHVKWFAAALVGGLGTFAFASLFTDVARLLLGVDAAPKGSQWFLDAGYHWPAIFAAVAVFPAVVEELAFRGIILPVLRRVLTPTEAIAVSAMMFMILHLRTIGAVPLIVMGVLVGILRLRSKSLWPCVLMHFTHNAMCLVYERYFG